MTTHDEHPSAGPAENGGLPDPRSVIEDTDWAALDHAYGPAHDTPLRLCQLLDEDPEVQAGALGTLDMSVLHQESLYSATPPAALYVAAILDDPRTLAQHENYFPWDDRPRPLRAALLEWLGQIADSAAYGETTGADDGNDPGVSDAVRAVRGTLHTAVSAHLSAPDPTVRAAALAAASALLQAPDLAGRITGTARHLRRLLTESTDRRERAATVLTIGSWGEDTTGWLADPDPAVRACAALAPGCIGNGRATQVILHALLEPAAVDAWFREPTTADPWVEDPLPQIDGRLRYALLSAAVERANDFGELLPVAMASVPFCSNLTVADDWGPLLAAAFPTGYSQDADLMPAQHRYLGALADRDVCWRYTHLIASWLRDVGLPTDRDAIEVLLGRAR
ncbi:HEAT repeat domain-containing protein [Streptomyces sp. IB201691-2A2]|uniref:HEAT repeat domain-containing protein n=1 Tax=Streptomyces sp. IB201691-2A2 TaxID=2561920 RepID=UPI0011803EDA|nr:HEAT repeat domain-containing protein [Streptomyces sp. IB201691-2A2]TRO59810.1 HEAT repeat domain-containing protein [Streptomyces sp. IB201691-2A2]